MHGQSLRIMPLWARQTRRKREGERQRKRDERPLPSFRLWQVPVVSVHLSRQAMVASNRWLVC